MQIYNARLCVITLLNCRTRGVEIKDSTPLLIFTTIVINVHMYFYLNIISLDLMFYKMLSFKCSFQEIS
jgi:hypothetical protein